MAMCEKCGKGGFAPQEMSTDESQRQFVGPCCKGGQAGAVYGISLSSNMGLHAYVEAGGMRMEYRKTPEELRRYIKGDPQSAPQQEETAAAQATTTTSVPPPAVRFPQQPSENVQ